MVYLATACAADDTNTLSSLDLEGDIVEDLRTCLGVACRQLLD